MQAYTKPLSLWQLVEQHVHLHEQDEIKDMLGASLVEQSQELHEEIDMLLDIWREMRDEKSDAMPPSNLLPEPPNQRDRLVQEICFFLDNVKAKAKEKGIDPEHILKRHNSEILDYASEITRPGSSMSRTSRSSDGRETPMMLMSPDRISLAHELTEEVDAVNKQLNYLDFDKVCADLRSTLEKEVETLLQDIHFLQGCLDTQADIRDCVTPRLNSREPTLSELREERSLLEKELFAADSLKATPVVNKPIFNSNKPLPRTPPGLSDSHNSPGKPTPMRASHSIIGPVKVKHDIIDQRSPNGTVVLQGDDVSGEMTGQSNSSSSSSQSSPSLDLSSKMQILPNPPPTSHSEMDTRLLLAHRKVNEPGQLPSSQSMTVPRDGVIVTSGGARRRTVSPGRVRVVDVTNIVDIHSGKGDAGVASFSSSTSSSMPSTTFTPTPPSTSLPRDTSLRPSSAHADRFRKMVLGCRDGE